MYNESFSLTSVLIINLFQLPLPPPGQPTKVLAAKGLFVVNQTTSLSYLFRVEGIVYNEISPPFPVFNIDKSQTHFS